LIGWWRRVCAGNDRWDVGRVTASASAHAVEVGEKGRLAGRSLGRAKAHPYISELARIRCGARHGIRSWAPVVWRVEDCGEGMVAGV